MEVAKQGIVKVIWNNKDVTADVSKYLSSATYTDREEGASDEATFVFENTTGIWSEDWYPTEGDTVELSLGYENHMLNCGLFQVDEITLSGLPDIIEVKCLAAGITKALRTRNNKAFEELTLKQIALYFANKHGLKLVDTSLMMNQINLERKTQDEKTDLAFLAELAKEYGFIFSVKGNQLIFTSYYDLDNSASVKEIDKSQISIYSLTEKTYDTYAHAIVKKRNKNTGKIVQYDILNQDTKKVDVEIIDGKTGNTQQAEIKVKAGLWNKNKFKQSGNLNDLEGDASLMAGINFDLTGFGMGSGKYHIVKSEHVISGDAAYSTSLEIRKTGTIPKPKRIPRAKKEQPTQQQEVMENSGEENEEATTE